MGMMFWKGLGDVVFAPTVASIAAPTASEVAAGISIAAGLNEVRGFASQLNRVSVPVLLYKSDVQIDGPSQLVDSGVSLIDDDGVGSDADDVARRAAIAALPKNATGYFIFCRTKKKAAMIAGIKVSVFYARIGAANDEWTLGAEPARKIVDVALLAEPQQGIAIV